MYYKPLFHNVLYLSILFVPLVTALANTTDGDLRMEVITANNLVVDSNIETPAGYGPTAAHLGVEICNTGTSTLTDVFAYIGDLTNSVTCEGTPGIYPERTVVETTYGGIFSLQHGASVSDATRYVGSLGPGECVVQYWLVEYPVKDGSGDSVTGGVKPDDDLWLEYDIWASADEGGTDRKVEETTRVTMRNEISASANKIWPNGDNKVPDEYLDAIEGLIGWRPQVTNVNVGALVTTEGIWYDFGKVNQGFDNDGDLVPDYNAWMQPVGDPSLYDPDCFRLVRTYGIVIVKLNDGTELLIPFEDELYFQNLPENNRGVVGLVFYEFVPLAPDCAGNLTPYQEVASGRDNEKFNADFGTTSGSIQSVPAEFSFEKSGQQSVGLGGVLTYSLSISNESSEALGFPDFGLPLVFADSIPSGTTYVAGSAALSNSVPSGVGLMVLYSADGGGSFETMEPSPASDVTDLQWWLDAPLSTGQTVSVTFQVTVPTNYVSNLVENCGIVGFGGAATSEDCVVTVVEGSNSLSGTVFEDVGSDNNFASGVLETNDTLEVGISNVVVTLYLDLDGDGAGDVLLSTVNSGSDGSYSFTNLPDGYFVMVVDQDDNVPTGYGPTSPMSLAVDLDSASAIAAAVDLTDNDFGFAPPLTIDKIEPAGVVIEGNELTYTINVKNNLQSSGSGGGGAGVVSNVYWAQGGTGLVLKQGVDETRSTTVDSGTGGDMTAFDPLNQLVYWAASGGPTDIWRKNADGTGSAELVVTNAGTWGSVHNTIEVDPINGLVFWVDGASNTIEKIDITGTLPVSGETTVITDASSPKEIALDIPGQRVFYVNNAAPNQLRVVNYDGTGDTLVATMPDNVVNDIEFDGTYIYYSSGNEIGKVDTTATLPATTSSIKTTFLGSTPFNLAIDPFTGDIYYVDDVLFNIWVFNEATPGTVTTFQSTANTFDVETDYLHGISDAGGGTAFDPDTTLLNVTLKDTFDVTELEFVSASIAPSDVDGTNGVITWDDIGPLNGGETRTLTVTFRALEQTGNTLYQWLDNDAAVTNSVFVNGDRANDPTDETEVPMEPSGSIAGRVWADDGDGWQTGTTPTNTGYEAGESGVAGVLVTLHICSTAPPTSGGSAGDCTGTETLFTTVTDLNGDYIFEGLTTGLWYSVVVDTTTIPGASVSQTGDPEDDLANGYGNADTCGNGGANAPCTDSWTVDDAWLELGVESWIDADGGTQSWNIANINFGYDGVSPVLFGHVWHDLNGDGVWDAFEPALAGLTVNASGADAGTAVTGADGSYLIDQDTGAGDLATGNYTLVTTNLPAGVTWSNTFETATNDFGVVNSNATYNNSIQFAVTNTAEQSGNWDFGFSCVGTQMLGDTVYIDFNQNGAQETNEAPLSGVDVVLWFDSNGDGGATPGVDYIMGTNTTDASGNYIFTNLPDGDFVVVVDQADLPANYLQTADPDETGSACSVCDSVGDTTLSGGDDLTQDFGYAPVGNGVIGDTVFFDDNGSGGQSATEGGISNIAVSLWVDLDGNGSFETELGSTQTDTNGMYLFEFLPDGDYQVVVDGSDTDLPAGRQLSATNAYDVVLTNAVASEINGVTCAGDCSLDADFGFSPLGSIGDFVYYDANNNGTQDWNEEGITNVTLQLWIDLDGDGDADTNTAVTAITAGSSGASPAGYYQFTDVEELPSGQFYVVVVDTATLPAGLAQTADPDRDGVACDDNTFPSLVACDDADSGIFAPPGGAYSGADFGYLPPGVIGDYVWFDTNGDGVQDGGEPGIAGVRVEVTDGSNTFTTTTDADGRYSFANLLDGTWTVSLLSTNFASGEPLENLAASFDADGTNTANSVDVVISGGAVDSSGNTWCSTSDCSLDADFGLKLNGAYTLSGGVCIHDARVLGDCDDIDTFTDDGVDQDAGLDDETELGGISVYLYESDGIGGWDLIGSTVTDDTGAYDFSNLPNGDYRVTIGTATAPLDNAVLTTTTNNNASVSVVELFVDGSWTNSTGSLETGSSVAQSVTIAGTDVTDVDFAFTSTVNYDFGDLPVSYGSTTLAGDGARHEIPSGGSTVYLGVTVPEADINGIGTAFADGDDMVDGSDDEDGVTPIDILNWANGAVTNGDGGSVSVAVNGDGWLVGWIDFNQDGDLTDPGELIISQAVSTGTITNDFDIPTGTLDGTTQSFLSRFRVFTSEPAFPLFSYEGAVVDGEVEDHLFTKPEAATLGNFVWVDTDGDGFLDPEEEGVGGITVNLGGDSTNSMTTSDGTQDVDGDGVVDPVGYYAFTGLAAGSYTVSLTPPTGYTVSYDEDSETTSPDGTTAVALTSGEQHLTSDFGLEPTLANITGSVLLDSDSTDTFSGGDTPILGVIVQIWTDPNGDGDPTDGVQIGEAYTDPTGAYVFSDVPPGDYIVVEIDPAGAVSDADTSGSNDNKIPVALSGTDSIGNDFLDDGLVPGSIAGTVYDDTLDNGAIDTGSDSPVAFVVITLYQDLNGDGLVQVGEPAVAISVTDNNGDYLFDNLPPGDYVVVESDPSGATSENDTHGDGTDNNIGVSLTSGAASTDNDFLDDGILYANISGQVRNDADGDGDPGDPDPAIAGVTVTLYADVDGDGVLDPGETEIASTVTGSDGMYSFTNLPSGSYVVVETDPPGVTSTYDIDAAPTDNTIGVTLAGTDSTGNDFLDDGVSIGDRVWFDDDADGVQDVGETNGVSGIDVVLYDTNDVAIATNTTDAAGAYLFTGLSSGDYYVTFDPGTLPSNTVFAPLDQGGDDALDSDADRSTGQTASTGLIVAGGSNQSLDAGVMFQTTYVLLSDFSGAWVEGEAVLRWETAAEVGTIGFFLTRSHEKEGEYVRVVDGLIPGLITSPQGGVYHLVDPGVEAGSTWYYQLEEVDATGRRTEYGPYEVRYHSSRTKAVHAKSSRGKKVSAAQAHQAPAHEKLRRTKAHKSRAAYGRGKGSYNQDSLRIVIGTPGLQRIDLDEAAEIFSKNLKKKLQQGGFRLTHRGIPVATHRVDNELWFYAAPLDDPYTNEDVYWLEPARKGLRMQAIDAGAPAAVRAFQTFSQLTLVEEEHGSIINLFSDANADYWYWDYILAGNAVHGSKSFALPTPGAESGPAHLEVNLHGYTDLAADPEHHAIIELNGMVLGELIWDGSIPQQLSVDLPEGLLVDGTNTVQITGLLDEGVPYGSFAVDGFEILYSRRYEPVEGMLMLTTRAEEVITVKTLTSPDIVVLDLSEAHHPKILENLNIESVDSSWQASFPGVAGATYYLIDRSVLRSAQIEAVTTQSRLRTRGNAADYLIIVPPGLEEGAQALADYRQAQGLEVMTIGLRDIFDAFSHGLSAPTAIRDFLDFAHRRWKVAPRYVVLAGSGTYDYKDHMGLGENLIPPLMVETPYGIFASDTALADINGDGAAEMAIGRLPALSNEELLAQVAKIKAYESSTGSWKQKITLAADNADLAGDFHNSSDVLEALIDVEYSKEKIYLGELSTGSAKQKFLEAFATGSGLINYIGHGGTDRVAAEGLLLKSDVPGMGNGDRPAVLVALTCSLGRFELPGFDSLGEDLVRHDGGGAVAVWAPSGLSLNHRALDLGEAFFSALYQDGEAVLGDAILRVGASYGEEDQWLCSLYNLIGDPALQLQSGARRIRPDREDLTESGDEAGTAVGKSQIRKRPPFAQDAMSSFNEEGSVAADIRSAALWRIQGMKSGMYLWRTDTPETVDILVNGSSVPAITLSDGVAWYVANTPSETVAVETVDPHRMNLRDAWPRATGEVVIVIADPAGTSELWVEQANERVLLMGLSGSPLVVDLSDPEQPVEIQAVLLDNDSGYYALYMSPGMSHLLVVEREALHVLQ